MDTFYEIACTAEMALGQGVNIVSGQLPTDAVVPIVSGVAAGTAVADTHDKIFVSVVKDTASYQSMYSAVVSVSGSGLVDSASASVSYLRDQTASETSISYVAVRVVKTQTQQADLSNAKVSADAIKYLKAQGPDAFARRYGTHFITGFSWGGAFVGRFKLQTRSVTDKESLAASLSATIEGFGVTGSINSTFRQELQSATTSYNLTAEAQIDGEVSTDFQTQDPDAMVKACQSYWPTANGNRLTALCTSWEALPDIQDALATLGKTGALSSSVPTAVTDVLRQECSRLQYISGTCAGILVGGTFALPFHQGALQAVQAQADQTQDQFRGMSLTAMAALTVPQAQALCVSGGLNATLGPIAHGLVKVNVSYFLDYAFINGGNYAHTFTVALSPDSVRVADVQHTRDGLNQQYMHLSFRLWNDSSGPCLVAHMNWVNPYGPGSFDLDGNVLPLSSFSRPTGTSSVAWPAYPGNAMWVSLAAP